ncbi:MAG: antibiotic biosynthesis monooxygenase [Reinekea sp.]|nr:antibiotic biosynthesis monooxygenase [Reinekea sp.]
MSIANTPTPPYYAVIFTNELSDQVDGYSEMADRMVELAQQQPGYLGHESVRDGLGITISYWQDEAAIAAWKQHAEHQLARQTGREKWYQTFKTRVAKVERDYGFNR